MKLIKLGKLKILILLILVTVSSILVFYSIFGEKNEKRKMIIIGLDGATWDVITPLLERNELPNFMKLMEMGVYGNLTSAPPLSPQSWTTIATGKIPEKHGINTFFVRIPGEIEPIPVNRLMIKTKTIWQILSENNKSVGILNWLITWPPEEVNGFIIPDWLAMDNSTYPPSLLKELKDNLELKEIVKVYKEEDYKEYVLEEGKIETENLILESKYLLNNYDPDLFAVVFYFTNIGQEIFWKYTFPEGHNVSLKEQEKYGHIIPNFYKKIDNFIKDFVDDEDITLIIVSDHGMGPIPDDLMMTIEWAQFRNRYDKLLEKMGLLSYDQKGGILWNNTTAYYCGTVFSHGVCINLKGREPYGIIENNDYEKIRSQVIRRIQEVKFVKTDEPLFRKVSAGKFPDIILEDFFTFRWKERYDVLNKIITVNNETYKLSDFVRLVGSAEQVIHPDGVIFMKGPLISKNKLIKNARTVDVTPTILYLFDMPIGKDMDGVVLTEAIDFSYFKSHPIKYIDGYDSSKNVMPRIETSKELIEKLKSLGYID
jgi:predicted AlkP superfamily phosphohydrolase/phosphomutase